MKWNINGGTVKVEQLSDGEVMVEQSRWNSQGGLVKWNSNGGTVKVDQ